MKPSNYDVLKWLIAFIVYFLFNGLAAQQPTQSIRGRIVDTDTKVAIPGATVVILDTNPFIGSAADPEGRFRLGGVPIGRVNLKVSSIGYEELVVPNLLVIAGKELVLDLELRESLFGLGEVVISVENDKTQVANDMAVVSSRNFTVEETKRFAGSFNDPARMVASYAGVNSDGAGNNDIIVRGNNSRFIQWKLEGIEIPNPNHFGHEGLTGGPISALNSQMLANSEFYTGAFSPQYGNALAGIFDMKLRKGNNERREHAISVGVLGTDVTLEGPLKKSWGSSYLVNYRYSTLGLLDNLGIVDFDGVPKYQDFSFKFYVPTTKLGTFSIFGLGGNSGLDMEFFDESNPKLLTEKANQSSGLAIVGMNHHLPIGTKGFLQHSVSYATNSSRFISEKPLDGQQFLEDVRGVLSNKTVRATSTYHVKLDSRNFLEAGVVYSGFAFDLDSRYWDRELGERTANQDHSGKAHLMQGFMSWRWRLTHDLTLVNGVHSQKTSQSSAVSIEPRSALRLDLANRQAITAGFGLHSKMTSLPNYFSLVADGAGGAFMPNTGLDLLKARHLVLGYENKLGDQLFLKLEAYHQYLFNIPIDPSLESSFSLLNQDDLWTDRLLVNEGRGENIGLELTLERYFSDNYYFLVTGSVFDSRYVAGDGVWRNTRFNGNYMGNILFGKEFPLNNTKGKVRVIGVNGRTALLGGRRLLPIDEDASIASQRVVYDESRAFEKKNDDIFTLNLAVTYRVDKRKFSQELKLDVQNLTGNAAVTDYYWNATAQKTESIPQLPTLPVLSYTVHF